MLSGVVAAPRSRIRGPYDVLYEASGVLWADRPGRMVERAATIRKAGRALDVGCGDGKNLVYLEQLGWTVDGVDVSEFALQGLSLRIHRTGLRPRGFIECLDAEQLALPAESYDLVVVYGLYHCLSDRKLQMIHDRATRALRRGGLLAFAAFNDSLPMPERHGTSHLYLRRPDHIFRLMPGWTVLDVEFGVVTEAHPPLVANHRHALTWALFAKST